MISSNIVWKSSGADFKPMGRIPLVVQKLSRSRPLIERHLKLGLCQIDIEKVTISV